jgi:hypothetical protein
LKHKFSLDRLQQIVEQDLPTLEKMTILPDGDGYLVFGCYGIYPHNHGFRVEKCRVTKVQLGSLRSAMSWCIFDNLGCILKAQELIQLDQKACLLADDIKVRTEMAKRLRSVERKEAAEVKLLYRKQLLSSVKIRLDKCVNIAKYWQTRGFNNETARTGRTSSSRTSR